MLPIWIALTLAAAPQLGDADHDARCVAAVSVVQDSMSEAEAKDLDSVILYFAGKLLGQMPPEAAKAKIDAQPEPDLDAAHATMIECAQELQVIGELFQG